MKTKSIIDALEIKFGYKDFYSEEEYNQIESLIINRFGFSEELIEIDFNDLLKFKNLKSLTISKCILDNKIISIISTLKNLNTLMLLNCDIVSDISENFSILNIKSLIIDDTNVDLNIISQLNLEELILSNIEIKSNITFNTYKLDIRKSNFEIFYIENINELIISYSQYISHKDFFDSYTGNLIIMEDNGQFIYNKENY